MVITGDLSGRKRLVLDSVDGDFFDEIDGAERFWERFRRERLGVVADIGELEAAVAALEASLATANTDKDTSAASLAGEQAKVAELENAKKPTTQHATKGESVTGERV